jgi:rod shape-determining protein MreD
VTLASRITPVVLLVLAVLVQVSIVARIDVAGASPDLVVLVVLSVALLRGSVTGAIAGFAAGVLVEAAVGDQLGPHAIVLTVVGYACGRIGEQLVTDEHPVPPLVAAFVASLVVGWGVPIVQFLVGVDGGSGSFWGSGVVAALLDLVIVTPVYLGVRALIGRSVAAGDLFDGRGIA